MARRFGWHSGVVKAKDAILGGQTAVRAANGEGAPDFAPANIGDLYVDTDNDVLYFAKGTESDADWIELSRES